MPDLEGWPWQPNLCPADEQFIDWASHRTVYGPVMHMGTGLHHKVGKYLSSHNTPTIGITASLAEAEEGLRVVNSHYQVIYTNIYEMNPKLLPELGVMTLFHVGEMPDRFPTDLHSLYSLVTRVRKTGLVFFYAGSSAWDRAEFFPRECPLLRPIGNYHDLIIFDRV